LAATLLVLLTTLSATLWLSAWNFAGDALLLDRWPAVAPDENELVLRRWSRDDHSYHRVDDEHRMGAALPPTSSAVWGPKDGPWKAFHLPSVDTIAFPQRGRWFRG